MSGGLCGVAGVLLAAPPQVSFEPTANVTAESANVWFYTICSLSERFQRTSWSGLFVVSDQDWTRFLPRLFGDRLCRLQVRARGGRCLAPTDWTTSL